MYKIWHDLAMCISCNVCQNSELHVGAKKEYYIYIFELETSQ